MVAIYYLTVYLIRIALLYVIISFGLSFIVSRELRKKKWLKWILSRKWSLILFIVILFLIRFLSHFFWIHTDISPIFTNADIIGNWQDSKVQLHFEPNEIVLYRQATDNKYQQCHWEISSDTGEDKIIITDENGLVVKEYIVFRFFGELRIMEKKDDDPDSYDYIGMPKSKECMK